MSLTTRINRWWHFKRYKRSNNNREKGFTLVEMLISLSITSIIMVLGFSMWVSTWRGIEHGTASMQVLDDEWVLYHALTQDLTSAQNVRTAGDTLTVVLSDGETSTFRLSPASHLVLRTLNGLGEVVVSTGVSSLQWSLVQNGLQVTVMYDGERGTHEVQFSLTPQATAF